MFFSELWEWFVSVVMISCTFFYINYKWNRRNMEAVVAKFPGPKVFPLIGNIFYFLGITHEDYIRKVEELAAMYSNEKAVRLWMGPVLIIATFNPDCIDAILNYSKIVDKGWLFTFFHPRSVGVFATDGNVWRSKRKLLKKMFHSNLFQRYNEIFNEQSKVLNEYLAKKAKSGTFDVSDAFARCTLDIICRTAYGLNMHLQEDDTVTFPYDMTRSSEIIVERMYKPWLYPQFIFKISKIGKEMYRYVNNINQFTRKLIEKRRKILDEIKTENMKCDSTTKETNDFVGIEYKMEPAPYIDALIELAKEENRDDQELALEAVDIILGGMDTSATGDSYVLVMLGIYRDWQDKVHQEIDEIYGNSDRPVTMDDLGKLVQLEMVIKEVLRLFTAPHNIRYLTEDVKVGDITFPAGANIYLGVYLLHRDKVYWSNPNEFHPEHFLPENVSSRPKNVFMPFSAGPRICPGLKYGMMSMKVLLTNVLRKFRVECDLNVKDMEFRPSLMLELVGGYPVRLIPRQSSLHSTK